MKRSIWIFLLAIVLPSIGLGWLALRSANEQQIILERRTAELYQKAADQGEPYAQKNLGGLYEYGMGVAKDVNKAIELYQKSADQGNQAARDSLRGLGQH